MLNNLNRKIKGYFIDTLKHRKETKTGKFYVDMDRHKSLKSRVSQIPDYKCPNPECRIFPDIDYSQLPKGITLDIKQESCIYLEESKLYYCPKCERSYRYDPNDTLNGGFDDEGIDISQSTDNPVNEGLKSNTIIRSFGNTKGNKVNKGHNSNFTEQQKTINQIEKQVKGQYKEYRNTTGEI